MDYTLFYKTGTFGGTYTMGDIRVSELLMVLLLSL